ncbi:BLUF domain-containing protein [Gillisia sp. Q332]|uniref:BLUF domain-containing protein n=1 Tax=Gillisia xinjiangensis TaxID=3384765 RepID=UPI00391D80B7
MRYAIVYVSTASKDLKDSEIKNILEESVAWNNGHDLTGILLYSEGNFFQIIEGEESVIKDLFESIKQDSRHIDVLQIFGKEIHKKAYDGYKADFIAAREHYDPEKMECYMKQMEVLEESTQKAVKNMLKAFIVS